MLVVAAVVVVVVFVVVVVVVSADLVVDIQWSCLVVITSALYVHLAHWRRRRRRKLSNYEGVMVPRSSKLLVFLLF